MKETLREGWALPRTSSDLRGTLVIRLLDLLEVWLMGAIL